MSFTDRLLLWFHIGFVIFAIGPVTIASMSTPRYIRARNVGVLRYLSRMTRVFGAASLGVLLFGIIAGQSLHEMTKAWVTASLTLFVVALVLLLLIMRDQHRAIVAVEGSLAAAGEAPAVAPAAGPVPATGAAPAAGGVPEGAEPTAADVEPARRWPRPGPPPPPPPPPPRPACTWPRWSGAVSPHWPAWSVSSGWSSWS